VCARVGDPSCATTTTIDPPSLAFTGNDLSIWWGILAALLLVIGGILVAVRRPTRRLRNRH
jgi:hypothetical protein